MQDEITLRIARHYQLPPQLASLLHVLIIGDCLTPTMAANKGLDVPIRSAVHRLRGKIPTLLVESQRSVGYWLSDTLRLSMATEIGVELPSSTLARMTRERRIAEGVVEILETHSAQCLSSGADDGHPEV